MGYYTNYKLENVVGDTSNVNHELAIAEISGYGNPFDDICKWYDHEEHMMEYSKKFPDVIFEIYGEGEEAGDIWKRYFKNGKCQFCEAKITFGEFDEDKMY